MAVVVTRTSVVMAALDIQAAAVCIHDLRGTGSNCKKKKDSEGCHENYKPRYESYSAIRLEPTI